MDIFLLLLSLIVSAAATVCLFKIRPNLFMFQLIERVFGKKAVRREWAIMPVRLRQTGSTR